MSIEKEIQQAVKDLSQQLLEKKLTVSSAESCTGGLIAKICTDLAGSSEWFDCGVVSYSNQAKQSLLNVDSALLDKYGAVSPQVAEAMVEGLLGVSLADIAVSTTGIAGPTGGSLDKPVGLVWFGLKKVNKLVHSSKKVFAGSRDSIRQQAVLAALQLVLDELA